MAIDFRTGCTIAERLIGDSYALDTFQLAGTVGARTAFFTSQPSAVEISTTPPLPGHVASLRGTMGLCDAASCSWGSADR